MTLTSIRTPSAQAVDTAKQINEFENHAVKDGKIVSNYADYLPYFRSDLTSMQTRLDKAIADAKKAEVKPDVKPEVKDEGYSLMSPFYWVGTMFSNLWSGICGIFNSIFSFCGFGSKEEAKPADAAKPVENK